MQKINLPVWKMLLAPAACYKALGYPKDARNARITGYIYLALALGGFYDSLFTLCAIGGQALTSVILYTDLKKKNEVITE